MMMLTMIAKRMKRRSSSQCSGRLLGLVAEVYYGRPWILIVIVTGIEFVQGLFLIFQG